MNSKQPSFPFFVETIVRELTAEELAVVNKLLEEADAKYRVQVPALKVVGRCGCAKCPTVFFLKPGPQRQEQDLSTYAGKDAAGGLVAAVLTQSQGSLAQLEFYCVDGHDPWYAPNAHDLRRYE